MEFILAILILVWVTVLWAKVGRHRRDFEMWREALQGVQQAGANLEYRVSSLEIRKVASGYRAASAPTAEETPHVGTSQVATPSVNAPKVDAPKVDAPKVDAPNVDAPNVDAPNVEPQVAAHAATSNPITLEQWVGVRGAAAMGAAVLVLAGIYFFKYSIDNELLSTGMRVVLGAGAGVAATVSAELWLRRRHELLANCLAGAGMAIFYLTIWAAFARYGLIGTKTAGALSVVVTIASSGMAIKRSSLAIAVLGLVGGFSTPMLLSTGSDRPFVLFSYLALLNIGILLVAYGRRWPGLALMSLVATSAYQALWILGRMGPDRIGIGIVVCAVFAAMFSFASERRAANEPDTSKPWRLVHGAALAIPMGFAFYLSVAVDMRARFGNVGLLLSGLLVGAAAVARRESWPRLLQVNLASALCVLSAWLVTHGLEHAWLVGGFCVAVALLLQTLVEIDKGANGTAATCAGWIFGSFFITIAAVAADAHGFTPWPGMLTWLGLALIAMRNGAMSGHAATVIGSAAALGTGVLFSGARYLGDASSSQAQSFVAAAMAIVIIYQLATLLLRDPRSRRMAGHAATLMPLLALLVLPAAVAMSPGLYAMASLSLLLLTALATLRTGSSNWLMLGVGLAALAQSRPGLLQNMQVSTASTTGTHADALGVALLAHGAAAVFVCVWPLLANQRVRDRTAAWRTAALAPVTMFLPMAAVHRHWLGEPGLAFLAAALGTLTLGTLLVSRRRGPKTNDVRRSLSTWLGGASIGFVVVALLLALEHEWLTITWALLATVLIVLWRRADHAGLKYVALTLNAAVFLRLMFVFDVAGYHQTVGLPVFNWLAYTYLVPVACLVLNIALLRRLEKGRLRDWEPVHFDRRPLSATLYGAAAIVLGFVWINLTIVDVFDVGAPLNLNITRLPARDLTLSISWAAYGLALLGAGMWRTAGALRKAGLALIVITCGKVFLFDLAHLRDLYRVMSLTGLALSLIAVSFAYNQFVSREQASHP